MSSIKHPEIEIQMPDPASELGNAYGVLWVVLNEMRRANLPLAERDEFVVEAMGGDYEHLRRTVRRWVTVIQ